MAVGLALRQKQAAVLKWLFPLTASYTLAALYYLYQIGFRLLHLRAGLAPTMIAYGFLIVGGPVSLYATWRIFGFVKGPPLTGAPQQEEGVWPPPPARKL